MIKKTLATIALVVISVLNPAHAKYPDRPIRLIVPFPAGGSTDLIARTFADLLGKKLNQPVTVDNRAGANGSIGISAVARSEPDGYTLGSTVSEPLTINPHIMGSLQYDVDTQIDPLALVARTHFVLVASKKFPASDLQSAIALAKKSPGKYTAGVYSIAEMFIASFEYDTGTRFLHVPYQGASPTLTALLGDQVDLTVVATSTAQSVGDRAKIIAVGSALPLPIFPNVKTFAEQGMPGFVMGNWSSIIAPAGLSDNVKSILLPAIESVVKSSEFKERMATAGIDADYAPGGDVRKLIQSDSARWKRLIDEKMVSVKK